MRAFAQIANLTAIGKSGADAVTTRNKAFLMATAAILASTLGSQAAFAAGTLAGTTLNNTASIGYNVNSIAQTAVVTTQNVTVDRKIAFTIAIANGDITPNVIPGQTNAVMRFSVANQSNAPLDLAATVTQYATGTAPPSFSPDSFDVQAASLYTDTNGNGSFDSGVDLPIAYIDELAPDAQRTIFYVGNIPASATQTTFAWMQLSLQAHDGDGVGTLGAAAVATTGANSAGVDTVFADGAGENDGQRDGAYTMWNGFEIRTAELTMQRYSEVLSNPLEGVRSDTTFPKSIPGAKLEYCIIVANSLSSPDITDVTLVDKLPANLTFDTDFGVLVGGDSNKLLSCLGTGTQVPGATAYNAATRTLTATIPVIAGGEQKTVIYRATVD